MSTDGTEMLIMTIMDKLGDLPKEWMPRWRSIQTNSTRPEPLDPDSKRILPDNINHFLLQLQF